MDSLHSKTRRGRREEPRSFYDGSDRSTTTHERFLKKVKVIALLQQVSTREVRYATFRVVTFT